MEPGRSVTQGLTLKLAPHHPLIKCSRFGGRCNMHDAKYIDEVKFFDHLGHGLRSTLDQIAHSIPSQCEVCRGWAQQAVCGVCVNRFAQPRPRCIQCAALVPDGVMRCGACVLRPPNFDTACAAVDYAFPWNSLLIRLKFHEGLELLPCLVQRMLVAHTAQSPPTELGLLVPVPLSRQRLQERGFNQAWELARRLAPALDCRTDSSILLRVRDTPHQLNLSRSKRESAIKDAFVVDPHRRAEIAGQPITVVDDVMTTMATANEVARALKLAGARSVHLWCLARTADVHTMS